MTHIEAVRARRERAKQMAAMIAEGKTLKEAGHIHGVSRQRVSQLLKESGLTRKVQYVAGMETR